MSRNWRFVILCVCLILLFIAGLTVTFYPVLSDWIFSISLHNEIRSYNSKVNVLSTNEHDDKMKDAEIFNEMLLENSLEKNNALIENTNYNNLLSIDNSGIMGYLVIDKINVNVPIYHGSGKYILQKGVGHYEGSSLPIMGDSVHAVLVGHTGLPSAKIISDLDKMVVGDSFKIVILNKVYEYEVNQIKVVRPDDLSDLEIIRGKQYATIITCTPYGVNSHRLLVRGECKMINDTNDEMSNTRAKFDVWPYVVIIFIIFLILIVRAGM